MKSISPVLLVAAMSAITLGLPLSLYAFLTRSRRQAMREIKFKARENGWQFHLRRWQGNPTAFRIDGQTQSGQPWVITSGSSGDYNPGWTTVLAQRFPTLAGQMDFAIWQRAAGDEGMLSGAMNLPTESTARVGAVSGTLAGALDFMGKAHESLTGSQPFDEKYRVLLAPGQALPMPIDRALAERMLYWPAGCVALHSITAWRDPFGFHFHARLRAPANWATLVYLASLTEDLISRMPPPRPASNKEGIVDRIAARFVH